MPQDDSTTEMIAPDHRVYSVPNTQLAAYKAAGYVAPDPNIDHEAIQEHFGGFAGAGKSFLLSTFGGLPVAKSLIAGVSTQEQAQAWKESFEAAHREHPVLDFVGRGLGAVGGTAAAIAAVAGTGGLAAGALGAGGAAAAEAGLGVAAEAGLGAAAEAGLGATAATAATQGVSGAVGAMGADSLAGLAARGAVSSAALGHIQRIDESMLAHAADPLGKEKIQWGINSHDLVDAAIGAALPVAGSLASKALRVVGEKVGASGMAAMRRATTVGWKMEEIERQGRTGDVVAKVEDILKSGRQNPRRYADIRVADAGATLETLKSAMANPFLDKAATEEVKKRIIKAVGADNRVLPRLDEFFEKEAWSIDTMQKVNEKIYKEIQFSEPGLQRARDRAYLRAADVVKSGMMKVAQDNDPSATGELSQRLTTAFKEYSDWSLAKYALKRGVKPAGLRDILHNVVSGAASGLMVGTFGGFGGPANAAANNAAYQAVKNINAYHYGQAAHALGSVMSWGSRSLARVVESGLYGVPMLGIESGVRPYFTKQEYHNVASKLAAAANDPEQSFVHIHKSMVGRGLPEDIAEDAALAQHAQVQGLASSLPGRSTAPDVVTRSQGDPVQQRRLMGQVRTLQDPTYGLAHPTKSNMEMLQKHYPNILASAQQAVLSQLHRNPEVSTAGKTWSSRVLGRPINNLSSPTFSAMLAQARQEMAQREAQGQQRGSAQSKRTTGDTSSATRMDQLQGGDG